jgi:hypothetical protein
VDLWFNYLYTHVCYLIWKGLLSSMKVDVWDIITLETVELIMQVRFRVLDLGWCKTYALNENDSMPKEWTLLLRGKRKKTQLIVLLLYDLCPTKFQQYFTKFYFLVFNFNKIFFGHHTSYIDTKFLKNTQNVCKMNFTKSWWIDSSIWWPLDYGI